MSARVRRPTAASRLRRRRLRASFDASTQREYHRYVGDPRSHLHRELRERFLARHLRRPGARILEVGPGPGRFTPLLLDVPRSRVVAADISRPVLLANRRRIRRAADRRRTGWIRAAGEHLPLRSGSFDVVIVLGNIVPMAGREGPELLAELHRVGRRGALLIADFDSPGAATQRFFVIASGRRLLPRILRDPSRYFVDRILETGHQPYAPERLARWEFQFYTVESAVTALEDAGFQVLDRMSVAPVASLQGTVARIARREPATWENLLRVEEKVGRRPGSFETGHGFIVAARRR